MKQPGDLIQLTNQECEIVECEECEDLMVNIDLEDLARGDLAILKKEGIKISNPDTDDPICLDCEIKREDSEHELKRKVNNYMSPSHHDHDDSSFFGGGGFGGGFGGFGGGVTSGGGATGGF